MNRNMWFVCIVQRVLAVSVLAVAPACSSSESEEESPCVPTCSDGQECGSDGCGGVCGVCAVDQMCGNDLTCVDPNDPSVTCRDLSESRRPPPVGDLYVTILGSDDNDGRTYETAFATIQKGVSALSTGETLIIGPGEYFGSVSRGTFIEWEFGDTLGSPDVDTIIRAEIPGTVLIRGDIPAPTFTKLAGYKHIYVADFEGTTDIVTLNELDTLHVLPERANLTLLDYQPGSFYQDKDADRVYVSSTDLQPVSDHRYSFSIVQDHGFALTNATRVIVDGIAVTGFNMGEAVYSWSDYTGYTVWGIMLRHSKDCVVRNSRAFFNARGIGITSTTRELPFGGNLVEGCMAWANDSPVSTEDTGGISMNATIADRVENSVAYLNGGVGINIYGGDETSLAEGNGSVLSRNLSWGNEYADYKIKTGEEHGHKTEYSIGLGAFSHSTTPDHCLVGTEVSGAGEDTIVLQDESELDPAVEFADPDNFDFRLQSTSRFRKAMPDGSDRGPNPFKANVFFVSPSGSDDSDGMSVSTAWRTFAQAGASLEAGDTLYILPGTYDEDMDWSLAGTEDAPVSIRGRGEEPIVLTGQWSLLESQFVNLQRLTFHSLLRVDGCEFASVDNSVFLASDNGILATNSVGLRVTHSTFTGFSDAALSLPCSVDSHLAGNLYDNSEGPALVMREQSAVSYADYNSYSQGDDAWLVGDTPASFASVQSEHESNSVQLGPVFSEPPNLQNALDFAFGGPFRKPIGAHSMTIPKREILLVDEPTVHSVSSTTANIEWMSNLPTVASISWGTTAAMENTMEYPAQPFSTLSLSGLTPSTTYYFKINTLGLPDSIELEVDPVTIDGEPLTFTTLASDSSAQTYYVATSGDDGNDGLSAGSAWRSVQHAADQVNVGDTVLIAGGDYAEQVYVRASGDEGKPITFRNQPGERVTFDGRGTLLSNAFVVAGKAHLTFDGLYFINHGNANPWSASFTAARGGDFNVYRSDDITISRCLGYTNDFQESSIVARETERLTLDNVACFNHFNPLYLHYVKDTVVNHSVIARPWIYAMILYLPFDAPEAIARFNQTIFTDSFEMKAEQNIPLFYSGTESFVQSSCAYVLRDEHTPEWRALTTDTPYTAAPDSYLNPLFVNPQFAAVVDLIEAGTVDVSEFPADALMSVDELNFDSFYATNATVTAESVGLEPGRFGADGVPN